MSLEERYTQQMRQLLPRGSTWNRGVRGVLYALLSAMALEFARIHSRAMMLLGNEADPRRTTELLPDWERAYGLPGDCAPDDQTTSERRAAVTAKHTELGGQSRAYFKALAASLGFAVEITEYRPFVAGRSVAGDSLTNGLWIHVWDVIAPLNTITDFLAGASAAGEPLRVWGRESVLECEIRKRAPAHTLVRFAYG